MGAEVFLIKADLNKARRVMPDSTEILSSECTETQSKPFAIRRQQADMVDKTTYKISEKQLKHKTKKPNIRPRFPKQNQQKTNKYYPGWGPVRVGAHMGPYVFC